MAIIDTELQFANATSVAAAAGTAAIGSQVDLTGGQLVNGQINLGPAIDGKPLHLVIEVTTGIITAGSAGTIEFDLVSSAAAALTSPHMHLRGASLTTGAAGLEAGTILFNGPVPKGMAAPTVAANNNTYLRYLGIQCVIGTTTVTAGAISAYLTYDPPAWAPTRPGL
jgi:hypothetical protein